MEDFEELSFEIPAFTPETMPFDRLLEYLQQIAVIIGDPADVHLVDVKMGSTAPAFLVRKEAAPLIRASVIEVGFGRGTKDQTRAYNRVRRMLRRDTRDARRPAVLRSPQAVILEIPVAPEESGALHGVRQATSVEGALVRIGGIGDHATMQMQDLEGNLLTGLTASRHLAKEMAKLIYEPLRVNGIGQWNRTYEGDWQLDRMQVQSYEPLGDETLTDVIERLRRLNVAWPEDANEKLRVEREDAA